MTSFQPQPEQPGAEPERSGVAGQGADAGDANVSGWQGTSVPVSLTRLNAKIAAFEQALEDLKAEVAAVPHGALGMPVVGEGEVNLAGLMRSRTTLDALVTLIGARTDDFGETWKGFTCLLRGDGKATEAEVKAAFHASLIVVKRRPQLVGSFVVGDALEHGHALFEARQENE